MRHIPTKWRDFECGEVEALTFPLEGQSQAVASIIAAGINHDMRLFGVEVLDQVLPFLEGNKDEKSHHDIWATRVQIFGGGRGKIQEIIEEWMLVQSFYNGLLGSTRVTLDAAARGTLLNKSDDEAYELLEQITMNSEQQPSERGGQIREEQWVVQTRHGKYSTCSNRCSPQEGGCSEYSFDSSFCTDL
ncbi:hypothetical protein CDL15_Pgr029161 [Punica granatum]|uniref:Uncharacterized protein n=1 Tax=Punica granatum TaxID=22663 RepID=A0A218XLT6_PUNGR|nr:hypothetical protein CDL15_Pgr029161 [Punica granatum]